MAFSRVAALRSCLRAARPTVARPQLHRQLGRRTYASEGHGSATAGGDAVWAAGAVAVTLPTCCSSAKVYLRHPVTRSGTDYADLRFSEGYLLSGKPKDAHGHGHDASHGEKHSVVHEAVAKVEDKAKEAVSNLSEKDPQEEEAVEESGSGESIANPDTPDDQPKRATLTPTPDVGIVKRAKEIAEDDSEEKKQKHEETHEALSKNIDAKQQGLSNDDTRHSTDVTSLPGRSRKGEGDIETAKVKGSVDSKRPQSDNETD
ncbi:uncharacterized protein BP5553_03958 [Venustampulla echinocandica]|uniref:Uncharacterized protein n=1 Tax=Venustampulla echinocandica TaxID=2656787 RepID=A0A370TVX3_9HELO|nr:uncharacterized protein BP5553_03958 [Venustampulla echinocandica]RDL39618.1 hypothetical protein BP5553_03958 [Venustampulla echinocandica]